MSSLTLKTTIIALADHVLPRLPVILHRGPAGSMVVAGTEAWSRHLPDRFFGAGARTEERLGSWPVWKIHRILESWRRRVDLVAARVDVLSAGRFPFTSYIRVPEWIRMVAPVMPEGARLPSASARDNERLVRRNGLSWRVSHAPGDLAVFIERDYRPYTRARYGESAYLRSPTWFFKRRRHGGLVWIERDREPVAGMTYDVRGRSLRRLAVACVRGDTSLLRTGGMSATYLACFELARRLGCHEIDLRNCRPYVTDNLFQVKLSWGGVITPPDDLTHDLLIGWNQATPTVMRFLSESPLVVREGGGFAAVQGHPSPVRPHRFPSGIDRRIEPVPGGAFGTWLPARNMVP